MSTEPRFGLGLRAPHYPDFLEHDIDVDFVEIISENYMIAGGRPLHILDRIREKHPVAMHGVSLSVGSTDGLDPGYLKKLSALAKCLDPLFVSDHLCWTGIDGFNSHDLLPLPYTEEALETVCINIARAQDALGRQMLFENPSSYLQFPGAVLTEWEFLTAMSARTGCGLLLDVNNIFVSAANHGFDAQAYLDGIPADRVRQIHLAGHSEGDGLLIDTHDRPVRPEVWSLYESACHRFGAAATMIERDDAIPPLGELLDELDIARGLAAGNQRCAA